MTKWARSEHTSRRKLVTTLLKAAHKTLAVINSCLMMH